MIVALVLGVITTLVVAWSCALWFGPMRGVSPVIIVSTPAGYPPRAPAPPSEARRVFENLAGTDVIWFQDHYGGISTRTGFLDQDNADLPSVDDEDVSVSWSFRDGLTPGGRSHTSEARGWPFLAMRTGYDSEDSLGTGGIDRVYSGVIVDFVPRPPGMSTGRKTILPFGIIWRGYILDSILFAIAWFALLAGPGLTRSAIRRARGRCWECGYDISGTTHTVCPECGVVIPK